MATRHLFVTVVLVSISNGVLLFHMVHVDYWMASEATFKHV